MSPRNFSRAFAREVGLTPAAWVETVRVERAQRLLEAGSQPIETVARECGFGTVETLRRAFARRLGVSPGQYRDRFRAALPRRLTNPTGGPMEIAIPLFDRFTALDAVGPYQVLAGLPGAQVRFLGPRGGPGARRQPHAHARGRGALRGLARTRHARVPRRQGHARAAARTSASSTGCAPCTRPRAGRRRCAPARWCWPRPGVLDGLEATTHWMEMELLGELGAEPVSDRVVEQGKVITAAGVSAGIDMALVLAAREAGPEVAQAIQLAIEYDPQPPFDAGSPDKAPREIVDLVRGVMEGMEAEVR